MNTSTKLKMEMKFKRRLVNELLTTYLPSFLLLGICYATTFFIAFMANKMNRSEEEMRKCFHALDADGSGKISCKELETLFKRLGDHGESAKWNAKV